MARAASTSPPFDMQPDRITVPSKNSRISFTRANGLRVPACPPAPAHTAMMPSTPCSAALRAWRRLMTSWKTRPPYPCTASTTSLGGRRLVMMIGTRYFTQVSISACRRSLLACTIWLTAKGATGLSGLALRYASSSPVMRSSHSSSMDWGRAFSAGNAPTIPALHWASTRSGVETMNIGAPMTGRRRFPCSSSGRAMDSSFAVTGGRRRRRPDGAAAHGRECRAPPQAAESVPLDPVHEVHGVLFTRSGLEAQPVAEVVAHQQRADGIEDAPGVFQVEVLAETFAGQHPSVVGAAFHRERIQAHLLADLGGDGAGPRQSQRQRRPIEDVALRRGRSRQRSAGQQIGQGLGFRQRRLGEDGGTE